LLNAVHLASNAEALRTSQGSDRDGSVAQEDLGWAACLRFPAMHNFPILCGVKARSKAHLTSYPTDRGGMGCGGGDFSWGKAPRA
jgi:hypothetical protein